MDKSEDAYRTISEVGEELALPQHVLRFWETRFAQLRPLKRGGGRRYYRPDDIELLKSIKYLLYREGYTIRGVQRLLKEQGVRALLLLASEDGEVKAEWFEGDNQDVEGQARGFARGQSQDPLPQESSIQEFLQEEPLFVQPPAPRLSEQSRRPYQQTPQYSPKGEAFSEKKGGIEACEPVWDFSLADEPLASAHQDRLQGATFYPRQQATHYQEAQSLPPSLRRVGPQEPRFQEPVFDNLDLAEPTIEEGVTLPPLSREDWEMHAQALGRHVAKGEAAVFSPPPLVSASFSPSKQAEVKPQAPSRVSMFRGGLHREAEQQKAMEEAQLLKKTPSDEQKSASAPNIFSGANLTSGARVAFNQGITHVYDRGEIIREQRALEVRPEKPEKNREGQNPDGRDAYPLEEEDLPLKMEWDHPSEVQSYALREKLQTALDDLVACRAVIDRALAGS